MDYPNCPTSEECRNNSHIIFDKKKYLATYFPQINGYVAKCLVRFADLSLDGTCFDVYIWHDGEFIIPDDEKPNIIHFCDVEQIVDFAKSVNKFMCG